VARALQASDRCFSGTRIGNTGKCALDETGKYPVNENDEETTHAAKRARQKKNAR
jgi:hypothetical protein